MSILTKQTTGDFAGHITIDVSQALFAQFEEYCNGRFHYQMGGKCSNLGQFPPTFELNGQPCDGVDCSGYVRAILEYATAGGLSGMPDGSFVQDDWFKSQGFKASEYAECGNNDNLVRVCVHRPNGRGGDPTGHIWLCVNVHTVESYGGHGPGNRPWNDALLVSLVDDVYVLGELV